MMPSRFTLSIFAALLATSAFGQVTWQTTHTTKPGLGFNSGECELTRASLRVKVFPAYLDVEEDAEMAPVGPVDTLNDAKTLEISGNISLPAGAVITGALLWDGTRILTGNLLDRASADSLYASLMERNSTPPVRPRDPLILESTGKDTYRFRIYPAEPGKSRHLRLRYQLAPTIGAEGLVISLQAAIAPLFAGSGLQIPVNLESGGEVSKVIFSESGDARTEMVLPRTRLMAASALGSGTTSWDMWGNYISIPGIRIFPTDPLHQVSVKTSFPGGTLAGNYLNLYTGVTDQVLAGLHQRVEVVILWKWHNPGTWITKTPYGDQVSGYVYQAQSQASVLAELYGQLGGAGTKVGLLHDDSRPVPRTFKASSRGEQPYIQAREYLQSMQEANYVENFARGIKVLRNDNKQPLTATLKVSKDRFLSNLRLVKTLYSPDSGIVRHLLVISAGDDYLTEDYDMNPQLDSLFQDQPVTLGPVAGFGFSQSGFDMFEARRTHAYRGITASTPWGELPALPPLNLNVVVRNAKKAYDFTVACSGGLDMACGTLTFHGKSDEAWNDTLEWQAFDKAGKGIGSTRTVPTVMQHPQDTATALLWAGSASPFSEKKELPLGPTYGFVDRWASLLSLKKDSLNTAVASAYGDTGVPHIANAELKDIIPNYTEGDAPNNPASSLVAHMGQMGSLSDPSAWHIERARGNTLLIRIPGMSQGLRVYAELFDLRGKRAGYWSTGSEEGFLSLDISGIRPGMFLLKLQVEGVQSVKRITL